MEISISLKKNYQENVTSPAILKGCVISHFERAQLQLSFTISALDSFFSAFSCHGEDPSRGFFEVILC